MAERISVLIVEDHPMFVHGLAALLATDPAIEVVGAAGSAAEALALVRRSSPDVVVMDLKLPDGDGVQLTRRVLDGHPSTAILVMTMFDDDRSVAAALRAGARGYLLKTSEDTQILAAIHTVHAGHAIVDQAVAGRLAGMLGPTGVDTSTRPFAELTDREFEILELIAFGLSNAEISARLVLSPKTVRNHVSNVLGKIGAASRAQAIVAAREAGVG